MTDPAVDPRVAWLHDAVRGVVADRDWICTADVAQGAAAMARGLRALGARRCFLLAGRMGTGPFEPAPEDEAVVLEVDAVGMMEGMYATEAAFAALSDEVRAQLDAFDPAGVARVVGPLFAQAPTVAGRRLLGARPRAWRDLEDKTVIDALWDRLGVPRAPARVVRATLAALGAAHSDLDAGDGTVWAADNAGGWYGGGARVRWARPGDPLEPLAARFATWARQVRVMPFLEGIPCSIHGIALRDGVVALRPMEMLVLRDPAGRFRYARTACGWRPPAAQADAMRAMARRVGAHLRDTLSYRGVFTIDGVMTAEGFRPTELNPRFGAALSTALGGVPGLDPYLMHCVIADGAAESWSAARLEATLRPLVEARRAAAPMALVDVPISDDRSVALVREGAGWRVAREGETPDATAHVGPSSSGGIVLARIAAGQVPDGPSAAPLSAGLLAWLADHWGVPLDPLSPARDRLPSGS